MSHLKRGPAVRGGEEACVEGGLWMYPMVFVLRLCSQGCRGSVHRACRETVVTPMIAGAVG